MKKYQYTPRLIYFTGLSSSGKTTLSELLSKKLKTLGIRTKVIDGDVFRKRFKLDKYDSKSREKVVFKKFTYAETYLKKGYMTITSGVGAKIKSRKHIRNNFNNFIEIRIICPLRICALRDKKNLYSKKKIINSVNTKYEKGHTHDLTVNTYIESKSQNIKKIINYFILKKIIF